MSGRRIKNLILLILALAVCFLLLAVVPGKLSAQREESALHRGLTELLASYGVSIDPALLTPGETLFELGFLRLTDAGIYNALRMVVRILLLIMGTFLLTYTTSPIALTDALERLLNPLKKLRVPVHELAMVMSIALRFIPTLIEETDKIMSAQKARGADFESGNLIQKARALVPVLVPLFVSSFRRADELAVAMECRCYHGGEGRTRLHVLRFASRDYLALVLGAAITAAVIILARLGF